MPNEVYYIVKYFRNIGTNDPNRALLLSFPESGINFQEGNDQEARNGTDHHPDKEVLISDQLL